MSQVFSKSKYYAEIGYVPHEGQRLIHNDRHRFRVVSNGRRYGKTILGAKEVEPCGFVQSRHITGGPQIGWIVGPQYTDAEKEFKIVYDQFRKLGIDKDAIKWQNNADSGSLHIKTSWGFELIGKSAKHPETLVGEGLDFVLMVEAGRHKRKTWGQYIRPTLSDKRGWALFSGVPEGRSEHSLLYSLWGRGQDPAFPTWSSYRMPSWANTITFPGGRQDPEILEAEADLTEDEFNRQYAAMFVDKVGAVMQEWDDETHLRSLKYNPDWPLYMAVDYGFTNPFVVLWIQVDPWENVYVIGERRWTQMDTPEVALDLLTTQPNLVRACKMIYPDPAEPDDTYTLSNKLRIPAIGNTGGELRIRLSLIRRHMKIPAELQHLPDGHPDKNPRMVFDRSCKQLVWEMREGYRWPEHRSEVHSQSEHPLDKDNHGPEALGRFFKGYFNLSGRSGSRSSKAKVG